MIQCPTKDLPTSEANAGIDKSLVQVNSSGLSSVSIAQKEVKTTRGMFLRNAGVKEAGQICSCKGDARLKA